LSVCGTGETRTEDEGGFFEGFFSGGFGDGGGCWWRRRGRAGCCGEIGRGVFYEFLGELVSV